MIEIYKAKWILPAKGRIVKNGVMYVENGKILDIKPEQLSNNNFLNNANKVIDCKNSVITPGFINLHTHLQYTNLKKYPDWCSNGFINWIIELIKQYFFWNQSKKTLSLQNGIKESVLSGTTCIVQLSREEEFINILKNSNIKSFIFLETFSNSEKTSEIEFEKIKQLIEKYSKQGNLMGIGVSPHSIYNVYADLWKKISKYSLENDILVHTHLAESEAELTWLKEGRSDIDLLHNFIRWEKLYPYETGLNPVEYLEKLGVLNKNLIIAHTNYLETNLYKKLADFNVKIVLCLRSNMLLHKKIPDIDKVIESGILAGLGTDSKFSNYDLNILKEAEYAKSYANIEILKLLDMITIDSAEILGVDDKIGSLDKGKDADFLVFKMDIDQSYSDIFKKNAPDNVYVKGKCLVKDGEIIDLSLNQLKAEK